MSAQRLMEFLMIQNFIDLQNKKSCICVGISWKNYNILTVRVDANNLTSKKE
jgi:hypothetical protein